MKTKSTVVPVPEPAQLAEALDLIAVALFRSRTYGAVDLGASSSVYPVVDSIAEVRS